ncbi:MAG: efflux RND transporter periplasmic adaptor subunit [Deltaproteobacteria bacterium]|nr:MAG: efflux RND transporter periplasmic adaptor subunit [Deltaproteobacteria bacterium]
MSSAIRNLVLLSLCFVPLFAGCGADSASETIPPTQSTANDKATSVKVQIVAAQDLEERFSLPGSLYAWEDLTLAAEIAGPVDWVGPEEGETLTAGQKIMTIDSVSQRANLERNRVDADIKEKAMQRLQRLVAENLVSQQEYDNSVTAYEAARQNLKLASIALQKSIIKAPVAGVLDDRMAERGEYVKVGAPVALVVQVDRLKVLIDVPEKDVRYFHPGEEVSVVQAQIDTGEEIHRSGKLVHLAYKADPLTRTYLAKVEVDNQDRQLRPGLRRELKDAIAIPLYAVVDLDGRKVVYVEAAGQAKLRPVKIDRVIGDQAVILKGLSLGDKLIVKGHQLLVDGARVKVETS